MYKIQETYKYSRAGTFLKKFGSSIVISFAVMYLYTNGAAGRKKKKKKKISEATTNTISREYQRYKIRSWAHFPHTFENAKKYLIDKTRKGGEQQERGNQVKRAAREERSKAGEKQGGSVAGQQSDG
jgi:hypothetical protein